MIEGKEKLAWGWGATVWSVKGPPKERPLQLDRFTPREPVEERFLDGESRQLPDFSQSRLVTGTGEGWDVDPELARVFKER